MLPFGASDTCSGNDLAIEPGGDGLRGLSKREGRAYAA
jgi:hypothetical protein